VKTMRAAKLSILFLISLFSKSLSRILHPGFD
jgi:hypothetical protein